MPEIWPDHAPSPRTMLVWDGTVYGPPRTHTDGTLIVRGENQLFSIKDTLWDGNSMAISGADGYIEQSGPPAGEYWVVTNVGGYDTTSPVTQISFSNRRAGANQFFHEDIRAIGAGERSIWDGMIVMENGDDLRAYFIGGLAGDFVAITVMGYKMTIEV